MEELYLGVLLHGEGEHGELVVQPPAGDGGSGGGVSAAHDPGGGEAQGVLLVNIIRFYIHSDDTYNIVHW